MTANATDKYGKNWHEILVYDEDSPSGVVWKSDRMRGNHKVPYVFKAAGSPAGSVSSHGYWTLCTLAFDQKLTVQLHRVVYEMHHGPITDSTLVVDHIDGCKTNNKIGNLRVVKRSQNTRNANKYSNNSTGVVGVYKDTKKWGDDKVAYYYAAGWMTLEGKLKFKYFSFKTYGEQEAFRLACEYRAKMIAELNEQGAGYTERHGT